MEKIFLVEDEIIVREGIRRNIDWKGHGYEFCGEARDGELAYPLIQKTRPDIVITDIKMPFMDGIELSRLVKKEMPDTEIILLTGYEEFTYAKEAIHIGVASYLTKPITSAELLTEIDKVAARIREKKEEQALRDRYQAESEEKRKNEQAQLFARLVSGKHSMMELLAMSRECGIDISAVCYNILLLDIISGKKDKAAYSKSVLSIEEKLNAYCKDLDLILFERNLEGYAMLIKADSEEELKEKQEKIVQVIEAETRAYPHIRYFGGFGEPVNRMTELVHSFTCAQKVFAQRYFVEDSRIMANNILTEAKKDAFNIGQLDIHHVDRSRVEEFLKTGNKEEVAYFVEEFATNTGSNFIKSMIFRQYIVLEVYFCVVGMVEALQHDRSEITPLDPMSGVLDNAEKSLQFISEILSQGIAIRESSATSRYKEIVDEVIAYIQKNYGDCELSLNTLASHVNISPNHLSMLFSQETGVTLVRYLTDYRMARAKELLRCTNKRSSEISEEVGYRDPHYFSYLFKKTCGVTPTQYRGSNE